MSSHTALEYCSQPLSDIGGQPSLSQPFCLFCEDDKVNRLHCEREMVSSTKHKMQFVRPPYMSGEEEFINYSAVSPLTNGYCKDTTEILGATNLDLLSPKLAMEMDESYPVLEAFVSHILKKHKLINDLQKPNCALICTYTKMPIGLKENLLKFFFEDMKISKICLLPKALAISQLFEIRSCIVVDSGATR